MAQERDLLPRTVYLPPDAITELDRRARALGVSLGTLLRMIVLGSQPAVG